MEKIREIIETTCYIACFAGMVTAIFALAMIILNAAY